MDFFEPKEVIISNRKVRVEASYRMYGFKDIMIKGGSFYAVWDEERGLWSKDRGDAIKLIDKELYSYAEKLKDNPMYVGCEVNVKNLSSSLSKGIDEFIKWYKNNSNDYYKWLDGKIIFKDDITKKEDYATFKLPYSMEKEEPIYWNKLLGRLYSPEERRKIEYAIGAVIAGESVNLQKFFIFVGDAGTGKSTIIKIIDDMFRGYNSSGINLESICMGKDFALESLSDNPLIATQDDVELDKITENARLNSIISHETLTINEKHKKLYQAKFRTMIFAGANREVKITDARSGLLRRIIDIEPTGNIFERDEYDDIMYHMPFEYGRIAYKCLQVFNEDPKYYNNYYPVKMIRATNDMYNFVEDCYADFLDENNGCKLVDAWDCYKRYCELSDMKYTFNKIRFKLELKDYFDKFSADTMRDDRRLKNYYSGFRFRKIGIIFEKTKEKLETWLKFEKVEKSNFDILCEDCPAQYANDYGVPYVAWSENTRILKSLDPFMLHYVKVPENHIVIDFDIKDPETGEKSLNLNMKAANKFPPTYAELSKSGQGIHLHYIYDGDPKMLNNVYAEDIEIKVYTGNSALRRKLTQCVNLPIATINSGLPLKERRDEMVSDFVVSNEKALRTMIIKNLNKEYHPGTKPSIDYIYKLLEDAYKAGVNYDVSDLRGKVLAFAVGSSNHSEYCVDLVNKMHFFQDIDQIIEDMSGPEYSEDEPIIFYDVEVFPNLFVLCWKEIGKPEIYPVINPSPKYISDFVKKKLVGFNNRRYDNHILYGRMLGYSEEQLYKLSQKIINNEPNATFLNAYNLSYTDIYDFSSAANKQSLKKWEIELGIHHLELGLKWDQAVPEDLWEKVAEYCCNDVESTEAVWSHLQSDYIAREILADLSGMTVNNSTNQHSTKIIFGDNKHPQSEFCYRDLSKPVKELDPEVSDFLWAKFPYMMKWWSENTDSLLPYFPGYSFENGKSIYKGVEVGEGGYVEADPGMYGDVGLLDVASMHPHSMLAECIFGPRYTKRLKDMVEGRITIKRKDWDHINDILDGKLTKYIELVDSGKIKAKDLSNALKTVINSIYGLTSASFENAFRDSRNKDNIVAKRGALFMVDLAEAVKAKGWTVAHIKTDSIKIPNINQEIVDFVMEFGRRYGYEFEWEATYDKMCLVNDAVYIAKYKDGDHEFELSTGEKIVTPWTATGKEFQEPFIFKTLFSKTDIRIEDYAQVKSVKSALYLDMNEDLEKDEHLYKFVGKVGAFVPIKPGCGGGILLREQNDKMYSAEGSKGYRWLELEVVKNLHMEDDIDISYYLEMTDKAVAHLEEFGEFSWLVDPRPYEGLPWGTLNVNVPDGVDDEIPFPMQM